MKYLAGEGRYQPKLVLYGGEQAALHGVVPFDFPGLTRKPGRVLLPADLRLYELIRTKAGLIGDQSVLDWYQRERAKEQQRAALQEHSDVVLDHVNAHKLYAYQRVGANFIAQVGRVIVADEPGLGKTAQTIVAVDMTPHANVLVVCPNTLKLHWCAERKRWTAYPNEPVTVVSRDNRRALAGCRGWYIVNYELFRLEPWFQQWHWDWLIVDEAQNVKNRDTQNYKLLSELNAERVALLTGTPFGNNPGELWTLLNILEPQHFSSYWRFYAMYVKYEGQIGMGTIPTGVRNVGLLRRELLPRMIQRRKADVYSQLPPKIIKRLPLEMPDEQRKYYTQMAEQGLAQLLSGDTVRALSPLAVMLRLRQILSTPLTIGGPDVSAKLDAVMELILNNPDRVLVMTLFRGTVTALSRRLTAAKVPHAILMGDMGQAHAAEVQRQLNSGEVKVLVCTMQSGGVGLNLVGANTAIIVDKHYNPEKQTQAYDRIHRIGQTKNVYLTELYCPGTVDNVVEGILARKIKMSEDVFARALIEDLQAFLGKTQGAK